MAVSNPQTEIRICETTGIATVKRSTGQTARSTLSEVTKWLKLWEGVTEDASFASEAMAINGAVWFQGSYKTLHRIPAGKYQLLLKTDGEVKPTIELLYPPIWLFCQVDKRNALIASGLWIEIQNNPEWAKTMVTPWPWSNVYTSGRICWGHVTLPQDKKPKMIFDTFINSQFNRDLLVWPRPSTQDMLDQQVKAAVSISLETGLQNLFQDGR